MISAIGRREGLAPSRRRSLYHTGRKLPQHLQADSLTLLGVKLGSKNIFMPDRRGERRWIVGLGGGQVWIFRNDEVGMDEIDSRSLGCSLQHGRGPANVQLVPADLRHTQHPAGMRRVSQAVREAAYNPGNNVQALVFSHLLTGVKKHLHSDADAQHRQPTARRQSPGGHRVQNPNVRLDVRTSRPKQQAGRR